MRFGENYMKIRYKFTVEVWKKNKINGGSELRKSLQLFARSCISVTDHFFMYIYECGTFIV